MTKGEKIVYAIKKECQRDSLGELCNMYGFTTEEFERLLEYGKNGFDSVEYIIDDYDE